LPMGFKNGKKMSMKVCILYGGRSGEHEVSLRSAAAVLNNIDRDKHEVTLAGINPKGEWFLQKTPSTLSQSLALDCEEETRIGFIPGKGMFCGSRHIETDMVLPILHGTFGEDGTIQGLLEMMDLPYAGCGVCGSAIGMDKHISKTILDSAGIPVVPWICLESYKNGSPRYEEAIGKLGLPLFIKPSSAGSSVGASKVHNLSEWEPALKEAFCYSRRVLVEQCIEARELECSALGNDTIEIYGPGEITPSHEFYDYEAKYTDPDGADIQTKADIDKETAAHIRTTAARAFRLLDLKGLARMDFFLERPTGNLYFNEANTMPGFTSISIYPMLCSHGGLSFTNLVEKMIELGRDLYNQKESLTYSREIKVTE